jgi:hypothetical protein
MSFPQGFEEQLTLFSHQLRSPSHSGHSGLMVSVVSAGVLQRIKTNRRHVSNQSTWLQKPSYLQVCRPKRAQVVHSHLELKAWEPGEQAVKIHSKSWHAQDSKRNVFGSSPKPGKDQCPSPIGATRGVISYQWDHPPFPSIRDFNGLHETHPHQERQSALLSPPVQILTLSTDTLRDISRLRTAIWEPCGPGKMRSKIWRHTHLDPVELVMSSSS